MKLFKSILFSALLFAGSIAMAQEETATVEAAVEEEPTFSIAGSIDTYYRAASMRLVLLSETFLVLH